MRDVIGVPQIFLASKKGEKIIILLYFYIIKKLYYISDFARLFGSRANFK